MHLRLNPRSGIPIYAQIVDGVRRLVASGELAAGEQLPTVRALAAQLRVHPNTVARAYDLLDQADVISTQQGRGTYVAERPDHAHWSAQRREALRALVHRALLDALSLGYGAEEIDAAIAEQLKQWRPRRAPRPRQKK